MSNHNKNEASHAIAKNFEIQQTEDVSLDEIKKLLAFRIQELLDTNMEKLLSILYRIDVNQKVTDEIFGIESKDDIAEKLADAVIDRQLEKLKSRERFKKHGY